jgi:hypothetical protein
MGTKETAKPATVATTTSEIVIGFISGAPSKSLFMSGHRQSKIAFASRHAVFAKRGVFCGL